MIPGGAVWLDQASENSRRLKRPVVTLSYAQSLDGCLALRSGKALALSGPETLQLTHKLRAAHDAILVGIGTVLADDPQLNVRLVPGRNPQAVVLDTNLRIPDHCRLLNREKEMPWIVAGKEVDPARREQLEARGVKVIQVGLQAPGRLDLKSVLQRLNEEGIASLMVEGGAQVITQFLEQRLVDGVTVTIAPVFLGGLPVASASLVSQRTTGQDGYQFALPAIKDPLYQSLGSDLVVWGRLEERAL